MPTSSGGFEQAYNAQAGVDVETHLIVEQHVTQHTNDKQEIEPGLEAISQLPQALGEAENLLADTGYFSEANVEKCTAASLVPFIPEKREKHNLPLTARFTRGSRTASECYCGAGHETSLADAGRESGLCHTQIHRGNGLWHH
jgi:IS5 family transposase